MLELSGPQMREVNFDPCHRIVVPTRPGIYIVHDLRGPLYVGKAQDLNRRYQDHLSQTHNLGLETALKFPIGTLRFSWLETVDEFEAERLEREVIRKLNPIHNIIRYH